MSSILNTVYVAPTAAAEGQSRESIKCKTNLGAKLNFGPIIVINQYPRLFMLSSAMYSSPSSSSPITAIAIPSTAIANAIRELKAGTKLPFRHYFSAIFKCSATGTAAANRTVNHGLKLNPLGAHNMSYIVESWCGALDIPSCRFIPAAAECPSSVGAAESYQDFVKRERRASQFQPSSELSKVVHHRLNFPATTQWQQWQTVVVAILSASDGLWTT